MVWCVFYFVVYFLYFCENVESFCCFIVDVKIGLGVVLFLFWDVGFFWYVGLGVVYSDELI